MDAAAVKAQRLGVDPTAPACPVTLDMLEEYEQFHKRFRAEVHANTGGVELLHWMGHGLALSVATGCQSMSCTQMTMVSLCWKACRLDPCWRGEQCTQQQQNTQFPVPTAILSPCSCFYLGQLRESSYPLNRAKKGDPMMKVKLG